MKRVIKFLICVIQPLIFFMIGFLSVSKRASNHIMLKQKEFEKNYKLYLLANEWLKKKQRKMSMLDFFEKKGFRSVAIYGIGNIGERLIDELKEGDIKICYGIDRRDIIAEIPIYKKEDTLPEADVMIVTAIYEFEEIEEELKKKIDCPIYSIEDIVYFMN